MAEKLMARKSDRKDRIQPNGTLQLRYRKSICEKYIINIS